MEGREQRKNPYVAKTQVRPAPKEPMLQMPEIRHSVYRSNKNRTTPNQARRSVAARTRASGGQRRYGQSKEQESSMLMMQIIVCAFLILLTLSISIIENDTANSLQVKLKDALTYSMTVDSAKDMADDAKDSIFSIGNNVKEILGDDSEPLDGLAEEPVLPTQEQIMQPNQQDAQNTAQQQINNAAQIDEDIINQIETDLGKND